MPVLLDDNERTFRVEAHEWAAGFVVAAILLLAGIGAITLGRFFAQAAG